MSDLEIIHDCLSLPSFRAQGAAVLRLTLRGAFARVHDRGLRHLLEQLHVALAPEALRALDVDRLLLAVAVLADGPEEPHVDHRHAAAPFLNATPRRAC